jgi:hypothetical protein
VIAFPGDITRHIAEQDNQPYYNAKQQKHDDQCEDIEKHNIYPTN